MSNFDWVEASKKHEEERKKHIKSNKQIRDRYKSVSDKNGANKWVVKPSNERDDYDASFVWSKDYINTAKNNATNRTNTGITFSDRYSEYANNKQDITSQSKQYFSDGYNASGDYLRKRISDLNQEAKEMVKQLDNNKSNFISTYGKDNYEKIRKELKSDIANYKKGGKSVLAKRDVVNIFKNDKEYKDDDARKTAYDDYLNVSAYYGNDLNYNQVQQELQSLKDDKIKAVKDPYYSKRIKYLENYGKNIGYKDTASYDNNITAINKRIKELKHQIYDNTSKLDKSDKKFKEFWFDKHKKEVNPDNLKIDEAQKNAIWNDVTLNTLEDDWAEYKGITSNSNNREEIKKLNDIKDGIQKQKNTFENYNKIISKYDDVTNSDEYKKSSGKLSKDDRKNVIIEYNKKEAFENLGRKNNQDEIDEDALDILSDKEKKIVNVFLKNNQTEKAVNFIKDIRNSYSYGEREQQAEYQRIKDAPWYEQIGHSILSVPASVVGGIKGTAGDIVNKITGNELNPYDENHDLSNYAETARSAVSDTITENAGSGWSWAYNTVMGMGDFVAQAALTKGIGKAVGLGAKGTSRLMQGIVSTSAYNSTAMQAKKDGLDDKTAMTLGFASGVIEWATEKYSIEALMNIKPGDKIFKSIAKNFIAEGSEEGASTVANYLVNIAQLGRNSDYQQSIDNYIAHGYTEEEAKTKTYIDLGKQVASDAMAGAVMGGVLGTGTAISSNIAKKNILSGEYAKQYGQFALVSDNAENIINTAKEYGIDTKKAEKALAELDVIEEEFDNNNTSKELHDMWQEKFNETANMLSELELYIEQNDGHTELNTENLQQELQNEKYLNGLRENENTGEITPVDDTLNDFDNEIERQAEILETSKMVENDLHERGVTNQDVIVNNYKAKAIADEVSKLYDGNIKVDGDIRTDKVARRIQIFAEDKGLQVVWFKNSYVKDKNGKFVKARVNGFINGKKLYLNADVPLDRQIFKHEYHHTLEKAQGYDKYTKRVENSKVFKDWIAVKAKELGATGTYNNQYTAVLNEYIRKQKKVKNLSNTQAKNEAFADFMTESLFSGKNFNETMNKLQEAFESKSAFQKFIDTIKDILSRIKEALGGSASVEALEQNIVKLQREIDKGKTVKNNTTKNGSVKFEINPQFSQDYDNWNKKDPRKVFDVGTTSETLQRLNIPFRKITWDASKIIKIKSKHPEMTDNIIKQVPNIIEDPIIIMRSKSFENRITMFGEVYSNNKPVLAILELKPVNKNGLELNEFKLASAYGKDNAQNFINKSEVLYVDDNKKRVSIWEKRTRLQLPVDHSLSNSNNNISQNDNDVNSSISKNAKNDTKFSVDDEVDSYTEKDYNNFGWVRANDVLTVNEYNHFKTSFSDNKNLDFKFTKNPTTKETIIPTGDNQNLLNVFVYTKGTFKNPTITKVIRINSNDTTDVAIIRSDILDNESRGSEDTLSDVEKVYGHECITTFEARDMRSFREYQRERERSISTENTGYSQFDIGRRYNRKENSTDSKAGLNDNSAFSVDDELAELNEKYGTIKKGANAERDIDVPKKTSDNMITSYTARSILEKGNIDGDALEKIKADVINEARSHRAYTDKQALDYAERHLKNGDAEDLWQQAVGGKATKNDIALGEALLEMYANSTELDDTEKAHKILNLTAELCEVGTRLGQAVQAFSLLKKMGGVGRLYYLQKSVNTLNKDLEKKYKGKKQVKIGEEEAEFLANAKTEKEVTQAAQDIMKSVGEQVPSTFLDKWNAWRYLSMLGNPRTHIRNLVGNAVMSVAVEIKNGFGTAMEHIFIRDAEKRTKAIKISKGTFKFANQDFKQMVDYISSGGKYNDNTEIENNKQVFKFKPLEAFRKFNFKWLEKEDGWFLKYNYVRAMSQALTAKKINIGNITDSQLQQVREYACKEAWKATYREESKIANVITHAAKSNVGAQIFIEGILPFKKTPINILKRGIEYSPIGIIKTLSKGAVDLKKGKISGSEFIDGLSSGLTGTGIMVAGMLLSSMGVAIGGFGGGDDEWFRKLNGEQEYSLQFGDLSYTIDWAAPACIPFFIGVELQKALQQDYGNNWTKFIDAIGRTTFEPIVNMSMLQGINDSLNTIKWKSNPLESVLYNSIQSYFLQALPTLAGQITRIAEPKRQRNYVDKNSAIPEFMQKTLNKISAKTGDWYRNDFVDAWGQYDITKGIANRIVQNMISPGYVSTVDYDKVNKEIARLYNAKGNKLVLPDSVDTNIKIDGETKYLTADEFEKYQQEAGQNAYKYINDLINSSTYQNADDDTKIEMITNIYSYAENKAKTTVSDYKLSDSETKLDMYLKRGVSLDEYFYEKYKFSDEEDERITLDRDRVNEILNDVENSSTYQNASGKKKMSMVDAVVKYVKDSQKNNLSKSDKIIETAEDKGKDISGLIINKGAISGKDKKEDKLKAIKKSGADSESKYISMAYEYLSSRKVTYGGKYLYFSELTATQKYKYISSNKSSIKSGLYEDYGV